MDYSAKQAARLLGVSVRTVKRWIDRGEVEGAYKGDTKYGPAWVIPSDTMEALRNRVAIEAEPYLEVEPEIITEAPASSETATTVTTPAAPGATQMMLAWSERLEQEKRLYEGHIGRLEQYNTDLRESWKETKNMLSETRESWRETQQILTDERRELEAMRAENERLRRQLRAGDKLVERARKTEHFHARETIPMPAVKLDEVVAKADAKA